MTMMATSDVAVPGVSPELSLTVISKVSITDSSLAKASSVAEPVGS